MKIAIIILLISVFIIYQPQLLAFYKLNDSAAQSTKTSSQQTEKSKSFDRLDYVIKWGIPTLLILLISWLVQIVFKQHGKITDLKNALRQSSKEKKINIEKIVTDIQDDFQSISCEWTENLNSLNKRLDKLEFLYQRERLYRELELQFIHWNGVENCIVFTDKERLIIKYLKFFDNKEIESWLTPRDFLLLGIYWEICDNNYRKGLKLIRKVQSRDDVSSEIIAACYLQEARILLDHKKNNINTIYKILEQAKKSSPNNISILFLDAKIRNDIGDYKIAALILEKIRTISNANLFPINIDLTLADVYSNMKNYKKALELVERFLMFHPYHVKSIKSKASIYCSDKNIDDTTVEQFCNQINTINIGDDPELHYAIALLEYRLKRYSQAEERLNYIIEKRPLFIDYYSLLANIYFELNREEELLKTLEIIRTLVQNTKMKERVEKIIGKIEKLGIEKAKKTGRFNILLKYE